MEPSIEKNIQGVRHIRLTESEKAELKRAFVQCMERRATQAPARSPYVRRFASGLVLAVVFFAYVGSAEAAVPGDAMYYFKIRVNEAVVRNLALTPKLRSEVSTSLIERRLWEAAHLAADARTQAREWELLREVLDQTVRDAQMNLQTLVEEGDFADAVSSATHQRALLSAHEQILSEITGEDEIVEQVIEKIESQQEHAARIIEESRDNLATQPDIQDEAMESLNELSEVLAQASSTIESLGTNDEARDLKEALEQAADTLAESRESFAEGAYDSVLLTAEEARGTLIELLTVAETTEELMNVAEEEPYTDSP